ncbi:MAG: alginate export family protein [Planctomycetota bacterium]|jgi:hypothetical protein
MRNAWFASASFLVSFGVLLGSVQAQGGQDFQRPKFQFLRQNEDWSGLADVDPSQTDDFWDAYKYMALNEDGSIWASVGGSLRLRYEAWNDFNFGAPAGATSDDGFMLTRIMMHTDVHIGEHLRAFAEFKSAFGGNRRLPGGRRALDSDTAALQQAFVDIEVPVLPDLATLTVRPGRQMLLFGKQRLVSPLPWANTLRTWDGVSSTVETDSWQVTGFWTYFAPVQRYKFNDADRDIEFYGAYATSRGEWGGESGFCKGWDLYFLGLSRDMATFNGTTGNEDRYTIGVRNWGDIGETGFDYEGEFAYQFGRVGNQDIDAYMLAAVLGFDLEDTSWDPRLWLGFDFASGDEKPGGDVQTFNQLFPLGHAYLGYIDTIGRQNIIDVSAGVTVKPMDKVTMNVAWHQFWLVEDDDALYNAGGGVVRAGGSSSSTDVGGELDITVKCVIDRHLAALIGYSHFAASDVIEESGSDEDINFIYVQAQYTF